MNKFSLFTVPNAITCMRIFLIPFLVVAVATQEWSRAFSIFVIAAVTDILDGYAARLLNQRSQAGMILDPLADKLLLCSFYITALLYPNDLFRLPLWFVGVLFFKEALLLGSGLFFLCAKDKKVIPAQFWGKCAMAVQSVFVGWLLFSASQAKVDGTLLAIGLWMSVITALCALIQYGYTLFALNEEV